MMKSVFLLCALGLGSCAALKKAEKPVTLRLSPMATGPSAAGRLPAPIAVSAVQARGLSGALRYGYVDAAAASEFRQAATLFWEESPTRVLERALVAGLRARFANVSGPELGAPSDRRVVARLDRFEEAAAGAAARAVVAFDVTITGKSPASGRYCASVPIKSAAGTVRARAFEAAITDAVAKFVQDAATSALSSTDC